MATNSLQLILRFEQDKEQQAANLLRQAEQELQANFQRRQAVADYRLEYMKRLAERSKTGITSATFSHFHAFVGKLDHAAEQVEQAIKQGQQLLQQRKTAWLKQRQKVQSIELLLDKQQQKLQIKQARAEQKLFDEIATQQYVRRQLS